MCATFCSTALRRVSASGEIIPRNSTRSTDPALSPAFTSCGTVCSASLPPTSITPKPVLPCPRDQPRQILVPLEPEPAKADRNIPRARPRKIIGSRSHIYKRSGLRRLLPAVRALRRLENQPQHLPSLLGDRAAASRPSGCNRRSTSSGRGTSPHAEAASPTAS